MTSKVWDSNGSDFKQIAVSNEMGARNKLKKTSLRPSH